jgi:FkbM family methyltransferase
MNELTLRLKTGVSIIVPGTLTSITTYVALEQEEWFEKEAAFLPRWLRPGMTVIDIGANLGVYSLPLTRCTGPHGHVYAYEPASEPRAKLERSRDVNRADNLHIFGAAVSDSVREGRLVFGASSELNSLEGNGPSETIRITCLDAEDGIRGWTSVDFVKIDAEGEEERILAGGKSFFERHSPLVMFEVKAGTTINEALRAAFPRVGYNVYRLHPGASMLVPVEPGTPIDGFELNLFAAKPDRAAALAREGFLLDAVPDWHPDAAARDKAMDLLSVQAFAPAFAGLFTGDVSLDPVYRDGLAGYAAWRSTDRSMAERCGALDFACRTLSNLCQKAPTLARHSTWARATWEAGQRGLCTIALQSFAQLVERGEMNVSEPFWPADPRFDDVAPGVKRAEWLLVSAFEQLTRAVSFSSGFGEPALDLEWLCAQPFASTEMVRRWVLRRILAGEQVEIPARLCVAASDHLNADIWRAGLVPNTWVRNAVGLG